MIDVYIGESNGQVKSNLFQDPLEFLLGFRSKFFEELALKVLPRSLCRNLGPQCQQHCENENLDACLVREI